MRQSITVRKLYTVHYYEYDCHYVFEGEQHAFWELVYADRGEALITRDGREFLLRRGSAILHPPGAFHTLRAQGSGGLDLFVISFDCSAGPLRLLAEAPFPIGPADKQHLSAILTHARGAFTSNLDAAYGKLRRSETAPFGSEQLIRLSLETLLIQLVRRAMEIPGLVAHTVPAAHGIADEDQLAGAIAHMQANLGKPVDMEALCRKTLLSRSKMQRLFKAHTGKSVMAYYIDLRMEAAKTLMRNRLHNFSEIAEMLGFPSIHYFSKQFKQVTGMTPTEYCGSLRLLTDKQSC